jgi:hypothetical protein
MKTRFQFGLFSFHGVINLRSYSLSTCEHIMKYTFGSQKTTHSLAAKRSCIRVSDASFTSWPCATVSRKLSKA